MNDPLVENLPNIVLQGEYAVIQGNRKSITTPEAQEGTVMILYASKAEAVALAHLEPDSNFAEVTENMLKIMSELGSDTKDIKCTLMGKKISQDLQNKLKEKGISYDKQILTAEHASNIEASTSGKISATNSPEQARSMKLAVLLKDGGETRLNDASQNFEKPSTSPSAPKTLRLVETTSEKANEGATR